MPSDESGRINAMANAPDRFERCGDCGRTTREADAAMALWNRENPICKDLDLSGATWRVIEDLRYEVSHTRSKLHDVANAFPAWSSRIEDVTGLLTCGLVTLYGLMEEMEKSELRAAGDVVRWKSRGIGLEGGLRCFICGTFRMKESDPEGLLNNVAAFVDSKEKGEKAAKFIGQGARLDYRDHEPHWIQVKVGACDMHRLDLEALSDQWYVGADIRERVRETKAKLADVS